jgi:AcrR family transcriptional regulator
MFGPVTRPPADTATMPVGPRGQPAKRASILESAAAAFCREGYGGACIEMIAADAGVSRQTVYNHHGDKETLFVAVVRQITDRCNAVLFETLATFPDRPSDLEADLVAFATRLVGNCLCDRDSTMLRRLIQAEGARYPGLFTAWREHGPGTASAAIAARLARLAEAGLLQIDDPQVAARQFMALVNADLTLTTLLGGTPTEAEIAAAARNAVRTFVRAYRPPEAAAG